jgi:hypothetical protein
MFGFPVNLQDSGVQKLTNDADNGFPKIQQREIFYSVRDGSYTDQGIWQTASGRVGLLPTINDDVYIRHDVGIFGLENTYRVNNLNISNRLSIRPNIGSVISIEVYSSLNGNGILDIAAISSGAYLKLYGDNNFVQTIVQNAGSTIDYAKNGNQSLMDIQYQNLYFSGRGIKTPKNNLVVLNEFRMIGTSQFLELSYFDLSVFGSTAINSGNLLTKSHFGNVLFAGGVNIGTITPKIDFSQGNPNVECRGGIFTGVSNGGDEIKTGTGTWRFTTNNQSITSWNYSINWDAPILIDNITLTLQGQAGAEGGLTINAPINGTTGSSQLLMGATGVLYFNTLSSVASMTTGIWNFTTNVNTIGYTGNYTATIPSYFTTFRNLTIAGTGTKSFGVNTTINSSLFVFSGGTLDFSSYNVDVIGTTTIGATTTIRTGTINKTGPGNVIFRGELILSNSAQPKLDFSGGNPSVELRGGISYGNGNDPLNTGTGTWTFTTNNQSIYHSSGSGPVVTFNCPILISGAITLSNLTNGVSPSVVLFNNSVNGNNASSTFVNRHVIYLNNASTALLMTTGIFDITSFANEVRYTFTGNYTIPYSEFSSLSVSATGTKTLSVNTTLSGNLFVSSAGILEASTFNLSVTGTTTTQSAGSLSKNGAGNLLFVGLLFSSVNFTGNPSVELRGGMSYGNQTINTGTGTWTFTTNNQTLANVVGNAYTPTFSCSILISGITLTTTNDAFAQTLIIAGVLNGTNGSSIFRMGTGNTPIVNYQSATQPMATGILDTSTNLNTWIYGNANQDIKGLPTTSPKQVYRNLTLNGGGTKTLQGFVSVLNTYTLTSPATLANNGFTLTNP